MSRARGEGRVDWRQLRALMVAGVKLDVRASRAGMGRGKLPPFVIALITYTVMGTLLAFGLRTGADAFVYSLFTISAAMFMTALTVIMEYVTIVVHPEDYEILAHRPIASRTYFWAKIGNLLFYVAPISLTLTVPAAVVGSVTLTSGPSFGFAHVATGLVACIATAAAIVLLYTAALKVINYQVLTRVMTYVHSGATLVLVLAYFLLPRMLADDPTLLSLERGRWVFFAPPAWFAGVVELLIGEGGRQDTLLALVAFGSAAAVVAAAMNTISLEYSRKISELTTSASVSEVRETGRTRRRLMFRLGLRSLSTGAQRAGYYLMDAYMRRDRKLRSRVYPAFGLPLAVFICALIRKDLHSPFVPPSSGEPISLQEIMGLYCIFVSLFFASAMSQSEQWKSSWIFYTAPTENRADLLQGARRLVVWRYLLPFFALLLVLLAVTTGMLGATTFIMIILPMCLAAFAVLTLASPHLPFSQQMEKTRQVRQIAFFALLGLTMIPVLIVIELIIQEMPIAALPIIAVLWALAWGSEKAAGAILRRRLAAEEFAG